MKKLLSTLIAMILMVSLVACRGTNEKATSSEQQTEASESKEVVTIKNGTRIFEMDYVPEKVLSTNITVQREHYMIMKKSTKFMMIY
ncbi:hypothetical protein SH2C18_32070 [Clostridium sediminicola]|uniref:hypothetical protein n=1 Tax=Clostridium sediminicola TaxID=3114879 RepID=UPI0031F218C6